MIKAMKPVRRRIRALRGVQGIFLGALVGAAVCVAVLIVSFLTPIEGISRVLIPLAAGCPLLGGLLGLLWPISAMTAARRADACGLKERTLTALLYKDDDSPMARLQRQDAEAMLYALPVKAAMPVRLKRQVWIPAASLALVACALLLIPNPQHDVLRARARERLVLSAQADEIEEAAEKLAQEDMTEEERRELRRITGEMAADLRKADNKREALEALDKQQNEMDELRRQMQQRAAGEMASALSSQPGLKGLAQAMESGGESEMQEALSAVEEAMQTAEGQKSLGEQLSEAAAAMPAGAAQQALSNSAAAAIMGNPLEATQALASTCNNAGSAAGTGANLDALMRMARAGAAQAGSSVSATQGSGGSGSDGNSGAGGGGGAGRGSTNQDAGYREGSGRERGTGSGAMEDKVGAYERIYDPTRIGGDNEASMVEGTEGNQDIQQIQLGPGAGDVNGTVPYNQVIGEYRQAAAQAMRQGALPATLQDFVNRYFDALID